MADPLLSSLCEICHIYPWKYCCPRCSQRTCSLPCLKRHKVWKGCDGKRDQTAFMSIKELTTPAGIDHDYNFLHAMEVGIERSDKLITEEKRLIKAKELEEPEKYQRQWLSHSSTNLLKAYHATGVRVDQAPKGMQRQKENSTNFSTSLMCLNWQVEWQRDGSRRDLGKVLETTPIGKAYALLLADEQRRHDEKRRATLTRAEKKREKRKRQAETEHRDDEAKKIKLDSTINDFTQTCVRQNPQSSAWNLASSPNGETGIESDLDPVLEPNTTREEIDQAPSIDTFNMPPATYESWEASAGCYFYLLRPYTPSSFPRVVTPLHPNWTLRQILRNRVVTEFPTIYALSLAPNSLSDDFMLEWHFMTAQNPPASNDESETDSDTDDDTEEGEIV